jgi:hypothetical protein
MSSLSSISGLPVATLREGQGIRLRRDSWVSVMYAEALNSTMSSVTLQSTDCMGFWDKSRQIFNCLKNFILISYINAMIDLSYLY